MNFREAISWLKQPGIIAIMPHDKDTKTALKKAMEALQKQIPMKVTDIHVDEYYCPACGSENNCNDKIMADNYCPMCGQRVYQIKL